MLGVVEKIAHRGKYGARAFGDLLALFGELDARLPSLDEAHLKLVLQLLDLHAERRLAHGAGCRGMTEMAGFRQRFEVAQLAERNHPIRAAYASYKEIRLEIIMPGNHIQMAEPSQPNPGSQNDRLPEPKQLGPNSRKESLHA